jgi:hypothetical protein
MCDKRHTCRADAPASHAASRRAGPDHRFEKHQDPGLYAIKCVVRRASNSREPSELCSWINFEAA